jgi:hypothetical protein
VELTPSGTEGYAQSRGHRRRRGHRELSPAKPWSRASQGLYFIGEVVDVTGWLGGYNFQWAWSSAHACAKALANRLKPIDGGLFGLSPNSPIQVGDLITTEILVLIFFKFFGAIRN